MSELIFYLDPDSPLTMQNQIRIKLVDGILSGAFRPGHKLPSSRKLAIQLGVSRITVVLAYQQLIAEGYLVSRQRSGIFVSEELLESRVGYTGDQSQEQVAESVAWKKRTKRSGAAEREVLDLPNWHDYPFPFIDGKYDSTLFPLTEWREASRLALNVADVRDWSTSGGDADDPMLIEEIRSKILTRRGIQARSSEILITMGTQNSLYLICQLLTDSSVTVALDEPGSIKMRRLLMQSGAKIQAQPIDDDGVIVDERLAGCDLVYATPSHQIPTAVVMSMERRKALLEAAVDHNFLIIEDDYECETSYLDQPQPALRSMDDSGHVIYVANLSKVLASGLRLGIVVADAQFIQRARELRRAILDHPPLIAQRTAAYFLSLGHYDALMVRLSKVLQERRLALRDALNWMRGVPMEISPEVGGTTYWVRTPDDFDVEALVQAAAQRGILIEPVRNYYANVDNAENCFRMGMTSLKIEQIRPGVAQLTELIRSLVKGKVEHLSTSQGTWLTGAELEKAISGTTILYREVYGAPCNIKYHPDGRMTGVLGFANEEQDTGYWRIEGDLWFRRWNRWLYGEEKGYYLVLDGRLLKFFNTDRQIVDTAFIRPPSDADRFESPDTPVWSNLMP